MTMRRPVTHRPVTHRPSPPRALIGMGRMIDVEVVMPDGKERRWTFRESESVLAFDIVSDDTSGETRAKLYILGGNYALKDGRLILGPLRRLRAQRGVHVERIAEQSPSVARDYRRTHGDIGSSEVLYATIPSAPASSLRNVARMKAITYRTDKATHGPVLYRHEFERRAQPWLAVDSTGKHLFVRGGLYTVTPHGIEDLDD